MIGKNVHDNDAIFPIENKTDDYMVEEKKEKPAPPEFGPYFFPAVLAIMGLWCLYDGWFSTDPDMQEHLTFNRIGSVVLLAWAAIDFVRTRRAEKDEKSAVMANKLEAENDH